MMEIEARRKAKRALEDVWDELERATNLHGTFGTAHHGYAVIHEELDELWDVVKSKKGTKDRMRAEAKQVAAMAIRFMADLT